MLVIAIESATDAAGVALADEWGTIVQATLLRGRRHSETIAPGIQFCCATAGITLAQVDAVVVDVGPGLFTGLRVGVGTAKALAYALHLPVVALTSLDVLAAAVSQSFPRALSESVETEGRDVRIIPVLDARRGEVVSAEFTVSSGGSAGSSGRSAGSSGGSAGSSGGSAGSSGGSAGSSGGSAGTEELDRPLERTIERSGDERLRTPEDLAVALGSVSDNDDTEVVLVGDGAIRYESILREVPNVRFAANWLASPPVAVLAAMGVEVALKGEYQDPLTLGARYVRQADARINWETRAPRQVAGL
jgi:tRNA threonylcarbamoyladenosine biosynthesis protein TsaB